ncbi:MULTISPECIES: hypothetical protein [Streptomyces]|uniref:hypothetical protein n=1 Tax=Streptomyces TaxID=1883 RepID=UPI001161352E|nr:MULTISPECIES: hypothetical protein [unclassified Streptomyces]QNQ37910.1 hypothetical protein HYC88_32210 [Streptomyces sp. CB00271]
MGMGVVDDYCVRFRQQKVVVEVVQSRGLKVDRTGAQLTGQPCFAHPWNADEHHVLASVDRAGQGLCFVCPAHQRRGRRDQRWSQRLIEQCSEPALNVQQTPAPGCILHQLGNEPFLAVDVGRGQVSVRAQLVESPAGTAVDRLRTGHHHKIDAQSLHLHPTQAVAHVGNRIARRDHETSPRVQGVSVEGEVNICVTAEVVALLDRRQPRVPRLQQGTGALLELSRMHSFTKRLPDTCWKIHKSIF